VKLCRHDHLILGPLFILPAVCSRRRVVPPGHVDRDPARPDPLEDGDRLRVREAVRRVTVHGEDLVAWKWGKK
jgi:hypothetical protein